MGSWAEVEVEAGNADDRHGSSIHMLFELLYIAQLHGHIHGIQRMIRILGYRVVEMRHAQGSDRYLKTQVQTRAVCSTGGRRNTQCGEEDFCMINQRSIQRHRHRHDQVRRQGGRWSSQGADG